MSWLGTIFEKLRELWPFYIVDQWESGAYYVCGRYWRPLKPGLYPFVPFFTEIRTISTVPAIVGTPRLDITLRDGTLASVAATATCRVADVAKALNSIDDYRETTQELLAGELADRIAKAAPERLAPEARGRLLASLAKALNAQTSKFGVEVTRVRFTTYVTGIRTYRLISDTGTIAQW
jgi:regulator of protease activity HflC (stomatin/prohibitin superfamily)